MEAVKTLWVVKKDGKYIDDISSNNIIFTDDLARARKYTLKGHATQSIRNYLGYRNRDKEVEYDVVKLRVIYTEVSE